MQRGVHVGSSGQLVGAGVMEPRPGTGPGQIVGSGMGMGPPSLPPRTIYGSRPSPGRQRAIASQGGPGSAPMATPDQFSPTEGQATSPVEPYSVRPGPTQVPKAGSEASYAGSRGPGAQYPPSSTGRPSPNATEHPLASDAKYPTTQALITDRGRSTNTNPVPVGAKRSASQGSLNKVSRGARTTSPDQRYPPAPVHNHMENQPGAMGGQGDHATVRPHPNKVQTVVKYKESGYSSSSTSGSSSKHTELSPLTDRGPPSVVSRPPHPQQQPPATNQDLDNVPGVVRRPMSFVKAVELSDALASQERERELQKTAMLQQRRRQQQQKTGQGHQGGTAQHTHPTTPEDRHNAYGSTYEISV